MPDPQERGQDAAEPDAPAAAGAASSLIVRRLTKLDPPLLRSLVEYGRAALGDSALDSWLLPVVAAHGYLLAGMLDGEVVGAAEVISSVHRGDLYLEGFYIRPEYQGRGYGAALLAGACALLAGGSHSRLLATVAPANAAARRLYERAGFTRIDYLRDHYGAGEDRLLVELQL